ncbi:MAG: hypothetical protein JNM38_16105 [Acidobacteria bacterium]|nr:hypothetical protein [Acidobacteriota bacterium]
MPDDSPATAAVLSAVFDHVVSVVAAASSRHSAFPWSSDWEAVDVVVRRAGDLRIAFGVQAHGLGTPSASVESEVTVDTTRRGCARGDEWHRHHEGRARIQVTVSGGLEAPPPHPDPTPSTSDIDAIAVCVRGGITWFSSSPAWQRSDVVRQVQRCPTHLADLLSRFPVVQVTVRFVEGVGG